jgi:hypothetical protein
LPKLSGVLTSAIEDSSRNLHPTPDGDGYVWRPPSVSAVARDEAKRAVAAFEAALVPALHGMKLAWLTKLGALCASRMTDADVKTIFPQYAAALDYPALCFTDDTRNAAARRFKFFPTVAELTQFLDAEAQPHRQQLHRLRRIAANEAPPPDTRTEEERLRDRQTMGDRFGQLARALRGEIPFDQVMKA